MKNIKEKILKQKFNFGDIVFFLACGIYVTSLLMGLSINDFTFAKDIIEYVVGLGLIGAGYSMLIRSGKLE